MEVESPTSSALSRTRSADARAVVALLIVIALVAWNRFVFDGWLRRLDSVAFILPWYHELGERLRAGDIPGWNPHVFGGTPLAADPQSGWGYLPAMLAFPFLSAIDGFKTMIVIQLTIGGLSIYALGRLLGMRPLAAFAAAAVFVTGPFLQWNTTCCTIFAQFNAWLPLSLLGVELAVRANGWRMRLLPWIVSGFAISQMLAGWVGEGWIDGLLVFGAFALYRAIGTPGDGAGSRRSWLGLVVSNVTAPVLIGFALGAAEVLPRLVLSSETNLAGGQYSGLGATRADSEPWTLAHLVAQLVSSGFNHRATSFGGAVVVLTLLAPFLAWRRHAVPFFAILTIIAFTLTLDRTPLHVVFYLIPRFQDIHEHDPWRVFATAAIGPAMLTGASVEALVRARWNPMMLSLLVVPLATLAVGATLIEESQGFIGWPPLISAAATTILVITFIAAGFKTGRSALSAWIPLLLIAIILVQPIGMELTGSWFGWPEDSSWKRAWGADAAAEARLTAELADRDPNGAGAFLQAQLASSGEPFRYLGYGGVGYPEDAPRFGSYTGVALQPKVQAILVNGRPMSLGLEEIQGYNPIELSRYERFITAVNGRQQNYHTADVLPSGVRSSLLRLLNVRYVLVDASLPANREDVVDLTSGRRQVFNTPLVHVFEVADSLPRAWIVHDIRRMDESGMLSAISGGRIDPSQTALIVESPPASAESPGAAADLAQVTSSEPDSMSLSTHSSSAGLLVVSEVYASGWEAFVDGHAAKIYATDALLRGVALSAGDHVVTFRYTPWSLRVGLWISGATSVATVAAFLWVGVQRVRRREEWKEGAPWPTRTAT